MNDHQRNGHTHQQLPESLRRAPTEEVTQMSMKITHSTVVTKTIVLKFFSITALTTATRRTRDIQRAMGI